ncbi:MAG TPA: (Fe-S)-binding protein [Limnobacter sp.]|nr:(Fe-S)-binding protein [Limnobacter sp.]
MSLTDQPPRKPQAPFAQGLVASDSSYLDEAAAQAALLTTFDTCDSCRRCVGRCAAFPALFDLIDESKNFSTADVPTAQWSDVLDRCHLCNQCVSSCGYAAPHPLALNVPQAMLRAKAVRFERGRVPLRDKLFTAITQPPHGLLRWPGVRHAINLVSRSSYLRQIASSLTGLDPAARLPRLTQPRWQPAKSSPVRTTDQEAPTHQRLPMRLVIDVSADGVDLPAELFEDLFKILDHNDIEHTTADFQLGALRAAAVLGDSAALLRAVQSQLPILAQHAKQGVGILVLSPSNAAMLKVTLPDLLAGNDDAQRVKSAVYGPMEYLHARQVAGLLLNDFRQTLGQVNLHVACGSQVFADGQAAASLLSVVPDTAVNTAARCSGHGCGWGYKRDFAPLASHMGKPLFNILAQGTPDNIATECQHAINHISQGLEGLPQGRWQDKKPEILHPLRLLCMAYGL